MKGCVNNVKVDINEIFIEEVGIVPGCPDLLLVRKCGLFDRKLNVLILLLILSVLVVFRVSEKLILIWEVVWQLHVLLETKTPKQWFHLDLRHSMRGVVWCTMEKWLVHSSIYTITQQKKTSNVLLYDISAIHWCFI